MESIMMIAPNERTWLFLVLSTIIIYTTYHISQKSKRPYSIDYLGTKNKKPLAFLFPVTRARLQNVAHFNETLQQGYDEYSTRGKACVLPTIAGDIILLPSEDIDWIVAQSDSTLSASKPHIDNLQCDYTFADPHIIRDPIHHYVIKSDLTRQLSTLTRDIVDELVNATDLLWGNDTENWKDVHVFSTIMQIVARTSNRVFVGLPLCRDKEWLANAAGFAKEVPTKSAVLRKFPKILRPLVAPILLRKNRKHIAAFTAQSAPEILRRQQLLASANGDQKKAGLPHDLLSSLVLRAQESSDPFNRTVQIIAGRLLAIQFAAIHTSTFSATNVIFDLVSHPDSTTIFSTLREEVESTLAANENAWTKASLTAMHRIDSALRESARLNSFLGPGLVRTVLAKEGITSPTTGTFCPYRSQIGVLTHGIHNDTMTYPSAAEFQPFRFAEQRLDTPSQIQTLNPPSSSITPVSNGSGPATYLQKANLSYITTSATYHPFGHGRHACPGRFFAANELKLLLAYIVSNYEFEPLPVRPESKWHGTVFLPPMNASVRVRRRRSHVSMTNVPPSQKGRDGAWQ